MNIELYLYEKYDKSALKILQLLDTNNIKFSAHTFHNEDIEKISKVIGESIRRLPFVMIDGERVGGYYDLFEFLVSKNIINYEGKSWKK
jgi:glutaredoxin